MLHYTKTATPADLASARGELRLRLTGFAGHAPISIDAVVKAIDALPSFHLEGLREIAFVTDESIQLQWMYGPRQENLRRKGSFLQRGRKIEIYGFDDYGQFLQVLYHEIGHFVYFLVISSKVKKQWVLQTHGNSTCVTPYATTSASEDFAESYAAYLLKPERLQAIPEKFAFMQDLVFSGMPETLKEKNR